MNIRQVLATAAALAVTAGLSSVSPASAADDTTVQVTLNGSGGFSIAATGNATATGVARPGQIITVTMPETTVTDGRGTLAGWSVTGSTTDLVAPDPAPNSASSIPATNRTIPKSGMVWATGTVTATSGLLDGVAVGSGGAMSVANFPIATALPLSGDGVYKYTPTVTVTTPVATNLIAGVYTGTVTQSLA